MSASTKKTTKKAAAKFARKAEKRYTWVEFESELFEGVFTLPSVDNLPLGISRKLQADPAVIIDFFNEAGVEEEALEAISEISLSELEGFINDWSKGETPLPKSSDS